MLDVLLWLQFLSKFYHLELVLEADYRFYLLHLLANEKGNLQYAHHKVRYQRNPGAGHCAGQRADENNGYKIFGRILKTLQIFGLSYSIYRMFNRKELKCLIVLKNMIKKYMNLSGDAVSKYVNFYKKQFWQGFIFALICVILKTRLLSYFVNLCLDILRR